MMKTSVIRLGGVTAVLGGLYLLILFIIQAGGNDTDEGGILWQALPFMPIFLTIGAAGLLKLAKGHIGVQIGAVVMGLGAVLMAVGFGMMVWFNNDNGWSVMFWGMNLQPIGFLLFGLANWRVHVLRRWNGSPLIVGLVCCLLLALTVFAQDALGLTERQSDLAFGVYLLTLAVGWILLGVDMVIGGRDTAVPTTATVSLFLLILLLAACGGGNEAKVSFQSPEDGQTAVSPVHIVMQAENFTVEPAGEVNSGAGHLHIMVDVPCLPPGEAIPKDDNHRHFGDGSTAADLELASGTHTLCLQAADGAHVALDGAGMTQTISVTVP